MSMINVSGLTFHYDGSYDTIFENVSFQIDTSWKLGFIGRNGKGKTTFLNLLLGKYEFQGSISTSTQFDYFPYQIAPSLLSQNAIEVVEAVDPAYELWKICRELELLQVNPDILYQPYHTLSHGERTKLMLAILFSRENYFLLIDEPTNHLDMETRGLLSRYLAKKKGFILVSHDRDFMDSCVDHVLVLNRSSIVVEKGNFSSWWENKQKKDQFEEMTNQKLQREIGKLKESAKRTAAWADKVERDKIGFDPTAEHDRSIATRSYLGAKSKKMQQIRKNMERRQQSALEEKEGLLKDLENPVTLKLLPLTFHKEVYVQSRDFCLSYLNPNQRDHEIIKNLTMEICQGERVLLQGKNGCGKSSIIKTILSQKGVQLLSPLPFDCRFDGNDFFESSACSAAQGIGFHPIVTGSFSAANGLIISYINQDTSYLTGRLDDHIRQNGLDASVFKAILRQLDFERLQFEKAMEDYSEGQKKKVLIATSLLQQAHLYIWDEPLNYIDVFSRMQIEEMLLKFKPTLLFVEHDKSFGDKIATKVISL